MEVLEPVVYNPGREPSENHYLSTTTDPTVSSLIHAEQQSQEYGGSTESHLQVTDIQWQCTPEEIYFSPKVVDTLSYINGSPYPVDKTFHFLWSAEKEQSTTWGQQWCIDGNFEFETKLPGSDCVLKIAHDYMQNTSMASVLLSSDKSLQVTISPRKTMIAQLALLASEIIELPFIATIKSVDINNIFNEHKIEGSWKGTLYKLSSSNIKVYETELGIM